MNFEKLDALSDDALRTFAEKVGIDVPPELERPFVIEELLEAIKEDSEDRCAAKDAPVHVVEKIFSGSELDEFDASLSAAPFIEPRYNETMIRLLVRDTAWAFAFWDVNDDEMDAIGAESDDPGFLLRLMEESADYSIQGEHFDIPVGQTDMQWYINLPNEGTRYRVDLCCRTRGKNRILARSNVVTTPRSSPCAPKSGPSAEETMQSLFFLSGADDLDIRIREEHHPSRILSCDDGE
ncbi:MAG: DUF4912 domain-containing protein [Spirochaetes bacterium]|nr:DUF4912 domain-containing protein [Spirochaetota bacterium]